MTVEEPNSADRPYFSNKEMWVRVDSKLDVVLNKQNHYDVELALLKARVEETERHTRVTGESSDGWRAEVRQEIQKVKDEQALIGRKMAYATGTVGAVVVTVNFLAPIALRFFTNAQ